jgi:ribosomal protein S27AE
MTTNKIFHGRKVVLATMHGKEKVIAPILEKELGVQVILPQNFDSDQFGTFTGDKARTGNQLEAARLKVKSAMKLTGADIGIASEGSFGAHPSIPFIPSNFELILLVDAKNDLEIRGHHRSSDTNMSGQYVSSAEEAVEFAKKIGFPEHAVVVRKSEKSNSSIQKGIRSENELIRHVKTLLGGFFTKRVYIETDMRAHMNPTRMEKIGQATKDLVANINSQCPDCGTPGFVIFDVRNGLVCGQCKMPTESPLAYIRKCQKCGTEKTMPREDKKYEDPGMCNWCNP